MSFQTRMQRPTSLLLLGLMMHSIIAPSAYALSSQFQPEYTHYESSGSTDMVNLATGDFQYSLPLLHVPGPNGGFSLPLSYNGGIQLDQDASWVGLGWSLNAGSIMRQVSQYADDVNDERAYTNAYDPGAHGHSIDFLGIYKENYDSEKGKGGSVGISNLIRFGFGNEAGQGALLGVSSEASAVENLIGLLGTVGTIVGANVSFAQAVTQAVRANTVVGTTFGKELAKSAVIDLAVGTASEGIGMAAQSSGRSTNINDWKVSTTKGNFFGKPSRWSYSLDVRNREERMYGALYLGDMETSTGVIHADPDQVPNLRVWEGSHTGPGTAAVHYKTTANSMVASDVHFDLGGITYVDRELPTSIAYDSYHVMAGTVSGNITPYRAEVGTTSFPLVDQPLLVDGSGPATLPSYVAYALKPFSTAKVPFRYENEFASSYDHHTGEAGDYNTAAQLGIGHYTQTGAYTALGDDDQDAAYLVWLQDQGFVLEDETLYDPGHFIEDDRDNPASPDAGSYANGRVIQGKHIEWYTNGEIAAAIDAMAEDEELPNPLRLIFYDDPNEVGGYDPWAGPGEGIGGLAITSSDGTTYHFALPVINRGWWTRNGKIDHTTPSISYETVHLPFGDVLVPTTGSFTETATGSSYAVNWLLTAITGPDYVDRGVLGHIDAADWGNWVKFDYGCHTHDFHYRSPYLHNSPYSYSASPENAARTSFMRGWRDAYYLDRIQTPTHEALFVKNVRKDGKSDYNQTKIADNISDGAYRANFATSASDYPSCSLRLSEILVLRKTDLEDALDDGAYLESRGGAASDSLKCNNEMPGNVLDVNDINSTLRSALTARQLLRIAFHHDYSLCPGTPNSFDMVSGEPPRGSNVGQGGKLTLRSISMYGRNNVKLMADQLFDYEGDNPRYEAIHWDGWGMYASTAGLYADTTSYRSPWDTAPQWERLGSHEATAEGNGWELTKITMPTGAVIEVEQERDIYSSVAGEPTYLEFRTSASEILDEEEGELRVRSNIDLTDYPFLEEGAVIGLNNPTDWPGSGFTFSAESANVMKLTGAELSTPAGTSDWKVHVRVPQKYGGDLRVRSIKVTDPFSGSSSTAVYRYTQDGTEEGVSSGVCAVEPEFCRAMDQPYFHSYDYPMTPVIYGKVTMLSDVQPSGAYGGKRVYDFQTPRFDMVKTDRPLHDDYLLQSIATVGLGGIGSPVIYGVASYRANHFTDVATSSIGVLLGEQQYDSKGFLHKRTQYAYEVPELDGVPGHFGKLGIFTEGCLQAEALYSSSRNALVLRSTRSTKRYLPTIPLSVTITEDGLSKSIANTGYDYITGAVTETEYKDAWGALYRTRSMPAFRKYTGMGPIGLDPDNANILSAVGEEYLYTVKDGEERVLNADVTTFKQGWPHRYFDGSDFTTSSPDDVWRSDAIYAWKGGLQEDGSYKSFVDFDWDENATQNSGWNRMSRTTRYDHLSHPVEAVDINGHYAGTRYDHEDTYVMSSAALARYSEIRCSGAEERIGTTNWYEGEVEGANKTVETKIFSHTGKKALRADQGQQGFTFTAAIGTGDDQVRRQDYRISVWVHKHNHQRARLYYQTLTSSNSPVSGGSGSTQTVKFTAGDWCLIELVVPQAVMDDVNAAKLVVGAENIDAELSLPGAVDRYVYFDDFRFHPFHSALTTNVYDPVTGQLIASLDGNNLGTRYTYDTRGRLVRTEVETRDGFVRSKEYVYTQARE